MHTRSRPRTQVVIHSRSLARTHARTHAHTHTHTTILCTKSVWYLLPGHDHNSLLPHRIPRVRHELNSWRHRSRIFEESVTCMQRAMEACRQLDFPPDTLASSELKIKDLRHNLDMHCSDDVTRVKVTSSDTEKSRPYMCCCFGVFFVGWFLFLYHNSYVLRPLSISTGRSNPKSAY